MKETAAALRGGSVAITAQITLAAVSRQWILKIDADYTVDKQGGIAARLLVRRNAELPFLPRFGVRLFLPKVCDRARYYGFGPTESYADKRYGTRCGLFDTTARENHEDTIMPQENGSHIDCDYVTVADEHGAGICVQAETPFSMNVSPYTQEELTVKQHNYELTESEYTVLCADYKQSGLGSNSCGPELLPKYRLDETEFTFTFQVDPLG